MRFLDNLNKRVAQSYFGKYFRLEGSGHVSSFLGGGLSALGDWRD